MDWRLASSIRHANMRRTRSFAATIASPSARQRHSHCMYNLVSGLLFVLVFFASMDAMDSVTFKDRRIINVTEIVDQSTAELTGFRFLQRKSNSFDATLAELAELTEFDISDNGLRAIPAKLFQAMTNVKRIILSKNPINTFEPKTFSGLPALQEIIMEKSNLSGFPEHFIEDCPLLTRVQINSSYVHTIPNMSIANLPSLEVFDLSRNNVTKLYPMSFYNLPAIHTLDLSYNNLTGVPTELFQVSKGWQVLDFRRNNISVAPPGLKLAVVDGWVSFERNIWVEIHQEEFANASRINELNLRSMGIFTVNSRAFKGMSSLKKLDLGDNVISVLAEDAFDGMDSLEVLSLKENNLRQVKFASFPPKLVKLGLESNQIDEMPTFSPNVFASSVKMLNLSHNWLWKLETGSQLFRFTNLVELDVSWNRLTNFTSGVFDTINQTVEKIYLDYNEITSVPRTTFVSLFQDSRVNISLDVNPGIGTSESVRKRSVCPGGSVFQSIATSKPPLFGCIQCGVGTYHDNNTNTCAPCLAVSSRAYAAADGSTTCQYCPYSSELVTDRDQCVPFACNMYCWMTIVVGLLFPLLIMGGKCLLLIATRSRKKTSEEVMEEQEEMDDWVVEQLIRQVQTTRSARQFTVIAEADGDSGGGGSGRGGPVESMDKIYDLNKDAQTTVLLTLQDNFLQRRAKRRKETQAMEPEAAAINWDELTWESFQMNRILSRNYHGEVFLGEYDERSVVIKRLMTLRFDVRELFDTMREVEAMFSLRHPHIVHHMGAIWTDTEYLCVVCEYVAEGDLRAVLEAEQVKETAAVAMPPALTMMRSSRSSSSSSSMTQSFTSATIPSAASATTDKVTWLQTKLQIMRDVASGLAYLHGQDVCHHDLRSRNVLITEDRRAKLNDIRRAVNDKYVGTSIAVADLRSNSSSDRISLPVVAPEVVLMQSEFQPSADIYACGILLAEIWCYKTVAFSVTNVPGVERDSAGSLRDVDDVDTPRRRDEEFRVDEVKRQRFLRALRNSMDKEDASSLPALVTDKVMRWIGDCLHQDPRRRPTAQVIVEEFTKLHQTAINAQALRAELTRGSLTQV